MINYLAFYKLNTYSITLYLMLIYYDMVIQVKSEIHILVFRAHNLPCFLSFYPNFSVKYIIIFICACASAFGSNRLAKSKTLGKVILISCFLSY